MYSVVIIDDNKIAVEAIKKATNWEKYNAAVAGTAYDGIAGLELIYAVNPDIVVVDIQMPGFNGLDIIKKIKKEKKNIQFIIISGYAEFDYAQKAIRYGVCDYLLKPIMTEEMEQALENVIHMLKAEDMRLARENMDTLEVQIHGIQTGKSRYSAMIVKALDYVDEHIYKQVTLTGLCKELMVSNSYFSKCFKREVGVGFANYVSMVKMENARMLLRNPRNRVNEVAKMLGYNDYAYFFQVFKKQFGYAPSDIKQNVRREVSDNGEKTGI